MTTILEDLSECEKALLISILDNDGVIVQIWDMCFANPPGKLVHWHASQLGVGIKRVFKIIRKFTKMGFVERVDYKRTKGDKFIIPKYDLTNEGRKIAVQLKREKLIKQQQITKEPSKCLMRVLIQARSEDMSEDFLFATLKHRIGNLESVKIRTENIEGSKYLITRGDVVVVTMKQTSFGNKVLMKTLRLSEDQSQMVKKYACTCSTVRRCLLAEKTINFMFVEQEPFIGDLNPCGSYKKEKVKIILEEWKFHTK